MGEETLTVATAISESTQAVSNLGFPVCMCLAMFWYINKQTEIHREETSRMVSAINSLEVKITQLIAQLMSGGGDENGGCSK